MFDAAVLRPGDKVLLVTDRDLTPTEIADMQAVLSRNFPKVKFVFATGFSMSRAEPPEATR